MTARCTGEPVSWLRLERYHLGEIHGDERTRIEHHLAACSACSACLERIEQDQAVALPPLPPLRARRVGFPRAPVWAFGVGGALAAAAAVILVIQGSHGGDAGPLAQGSRVKGNAMAFSLVRDDGARFDGAEGTYQEGDRFKVVVTCTPGQGGAFDVVVHDTSGAFFPLAPPVEVACGNDVPLSGAFRVTGPGDETVCLLWNATSAVDRAQLSSAPNIESALSAASGPGGVVLCKTLSAPKP
jgi:hypothetical protein